MTFASAKIILKTKGRGLIDVTEEINKLIGTQIEVGLCHVFLHHTSASLILCENADPKVQSDLELFMQRLVPDGADYFNHTLEGPDDMPAHIRAILTQNSLMIPIKNFRLDLGTWQGLFLWEHRLDSHNRHLTVSTFG